MLTYFEKLLGRQAVLSSAKGPFIVTRKRGRGMATNGIEISFQGKESMTQKLMACAPARTSFFWAGTSWEGLQFKKDKGARQKL